MKLEKFNNLPLEKRLDLVSSATLIDIRSTRLCHILLYQLGSFYIEIWYDKDTSLFQRFRSFEATDELTPYLDKIDLTGMF